MFGYTHVPWVCALAVVLGLFVIITRPANAQNGRGLVTNPGVGSNDSAVTAGNGTADNGTAGNGTAGYSTGTPVIDSTPDGETSTFPPDTTAGSGTGSAGLSDTQKNIIIGVSSGVGGVILLAVVIGSLVYVKVKMKKRSRVRVTTTGPQAQANTNESDRQVLDA